jgi:hemoglobin
LAAERIRPDQTLIERIGGRPVVDRIVDGLYARIETDESLRPMFIRDLAGEKEKQKDFWEEWLGGAPRHTWHHAYSGLQQRHTHIHITRNAAEQWLRYLEEALGQALESQALIDEVLAIARPIALALVNETTPPAKPGDLRCHRVRPFRALKTMAGKGETAGLLAAIRSSPALVDDSVEMAQVMQMAAMKGRTGTVEALIEVGVDPNRAAHFKEGCITQSLMLTPLCVALVKGHAGTAGYLREKAAVYDIYTAAYVGDRSAVADFLQQDPALANTDDPANDVLATTPLHHAVYGGHFEVVELLLAGGATVGTNSTPLVRHAANRGDLALTRLLVDNAADATRVGPGSWVLHDRIADLLLARGADVNYPAGEWIWRSCVARPGTSPRPGPAWSAA